jgi:hypothetical protein
MAKQKIKKITDQDIVSFYTDYVLLHGKKPNSVYEFAKKNEFEEADFYTYFASFEHIEENYFATMFEFSMEMITKSKDFENYDASQKLSSFYFTFIEMATANRSFVKYLLEHEKNPLKNLKKLKSLRSHYLDFVKEILDAPYKSEISRVENIQNRVIHEGAWLQFMSILKYWLDDTSKGFEKTDIFIEKSVRASFDVVYNVPIESIIDFGKFLWKERTQSKSKENHNS